MKKILAIYLLFLVSMFVSAEQYPKREFRGAWIQCVNGQYLGKTPGQIRQMLVSQLDVLQKAGINAILFQVRAEGDALYNSSYEPWSRYLTGTQGVAPADGWDPLRWMVEQCHQRNMECHAWINPYRAKTKGTTVLASEHAAYRHPERVFAYADMLIFNPALEENRMFTCMVVEDILNHYDVDGIHIDDYFYPYPVKGENIPDEAYFRSNGKGFQNIHDWRRHNVNMLVRDLHNIIRKTKPWVKFGVSPFGIYRNSTDNKNSKHGSATSGLQNYDDLYADVVLWQDKGWVDYLIPQIYWNIGTRAADYDVLCHWWNDYCFNRPLFIGQDVERTVKGVDPEDNSSHQMRIKYRIQRELKNIQGSCQWYAAAVVNNPGNYRTMLEKEYHRYPALQPKMPFIDKKAPKKPRSVKIAVREGRPHLVWNAPKGKGELDKAVQYVVYKFTADEHVDIDDASAIVGLTRDTYFPIEGNASGCTFIITALDRLHNESKGVKIRL